MKRFHLLAALVAGLVAGSASAAGLTESLKKGTPDLKSVGAMAFGPDGVLFVADPKGASVLALDTQDIKPVGSAAIKMEAIDGKIAAMLGTTPAEISIKDMKVNPASGNVYLSVMRKELPILLKVERSGKIAEVTMKDIPFSTVQIQNASDKKRQESITGISYTGGRVIVAGLSNEEFASNLRMIPFPFESSDAGVAVEIYHGAHGKFETAAPVRTFMAMEIAGKTHVLAAYTCTPLVKFPVEDLKKGKKLRGTTVAELGNRNVPLDMISYNKGGKDYVLISNSARGVMKVSIDGIDKAEGITSRISETAGLKYETIKELTGVVQLDKLDDTHGLVLIDTKKTGLDLKSIDLP